MKPARKYHQQHAHASASMERGAMATGRRPLHVVFAGGGTGGHLFPGLATADSLRTKLGAVRITFAGSGAEFERRHVSEAGYDYLKIPSRPLRSSPWAWPGFFRAHWQGRQQAHQFLHEYPADIVVGLGGYASVPMSLAAARRSIPLVLLEQNGIAGRANRWLSRYAVRICLGFKHASQSFPKVPADRLLVTGTPLRSNHETIIAEQKDSSDRRPLLVICGGSGGARPLNRAMPRVLAGMKRELDGWRILHQTGLHGCETTRALYEHLQVDAQVVAFVPELPEFLAQASLVVCRSGGTTLAELAAAGAPAILCPYPFAAEDHQRRNAEIFAKAGAGTLITARSLESHPGIAELKRAVSKLLANPALRRSMACAARTLAHPQAASKVVDAILDHLFLPVRAACIDAESSRGV